MMSLAGTLLRLVLLIALYSTGGESRFTKIPRKMFYREIPLNPALDQLFREAMLRTGFDTSQINLYALRVKSQGPTSAYKAYFVDKGGMDCRIAYDLTMYVGIRVSKYRCVNESADK